MRTSSSFHTPDSLPALIKACAKASALGFHVRNTDLRYLVVNSAAAAINRMSAESQIGKTTREIIGDMADCVEPLFHAVVKSRQAISFTVNGRLPLRAEPGHWLIRYYPVIDRIGNVQSIATFVVETTIERRIEEAVRLLDLSQLPKKEMQEWALELQHSLDVFDFAVHQTCRLVTEPQECVELSLESLSHRVEALDNRIHVLRKLLQNQADWLKDAACPALLN
jgi:hypothetical protein